MSKNSIKLFITLGILAFLVFILFSKNLVLLSDEYEFVYAAAQVNDWNSFSEVITSKIGGDFYRPVLYFSFLLDYWAYNLNPFGYYLTNSLLAAINVVVLALIVFYLLSNYFYKDPEKDSRRNLFVAIMTGLFFLVFPSHHEAVTWLAARTDLLAATWYLLAVLFWLKYLSKTNKQKLYLVLTYISAFLAFFTKEMSVTLIIMLLAMLLGDTIYRRWKKQNYNYKNFLAYLPLLAIFIFYLVVRRYLVGYWFGGYMLSGTSEFLKINLVSIVRWILAPISITFYSLNHAYFFQEVIFDLSWKNSSENFSDYLFWFKGFLYFAEILFLILTLVFVYRQKQIKKWFWGIFLGLGWIYLTVIPVIGLLKTIGLDLESSRFLYLPSVGICFLLAFCISFWRKTWSSLVFILLMVIMSTLYWFNFQPWQAASASSASIQKAIRSQGSEITDQDWVYLLNAPDNIYGGYVFRRGLTQMFNLLQPQIDSKKIIMTGRGVAGTSTPDCLSYLSDSYWLMNIDPVTGLVKEFEKKDFTQEENLISQGLASSDIKIYDLEKLGENSFRVIGSNPYIIFQNVGLTSNKIKDLHLTIIPEHDYLWQPYHLYWTTAVNFDYHEYYRHIWIFRDIVSTAEQENNFMVPVCRYPAFVFSDIIKDIKISLPLNKGEKFILK